MLLDSLAASPFFDVLWQLLIRIFKNVLLISIEYFWAQKRITNTKSIPAGKSMGHTSTYTKKYCQYFIAHTFLFNVNNTTSVSARVAWLVQLQTWKVTDCEMTTAQLWCQRLYSASTQCHIINSSSSSSADSDYQCHCDVSTDAELSINNLLRDFFTRSIVSLAVGLACQHSVISWLNDNISCTYHQSINQPTNQTNQIKSNQIKSINALSTQYTVHSASLDRIQWSDTVTSLRALLNSTYKLVTMYIVVAHTMHPIHCLVNSWM